MSNSVPVDPILRRERNESEYNGSEWSEYKYYRKSGAEASSAVAYREVMARGCTYCKKPVVGAGGIVSDNPFKMSCYACWSRAGPQY